MFRRMWAVLISIVLVGAVAVPVNDPASAIAVPVTARLTAVSSPGDWVGQGQPWDFIGTPSTVQFGGKQGYINFRLFVPNGDYTVTLAAPVGHQLSTGSFTDARRAGYNGTHPGLEVGGDGRGCDALTGSFVIHSLVTDVYGDVTELDVSFTQYCDGSSASLRGSLQYQAPAPSDVVLTSLHPITVQGEPTTFTAQTSPGSAVSFYDGSTKIGTATADSNRLARFTTAALGRGSHYVTAHAGGHVSPQVLQRVYSNQTSFWYHAGAGSGYDSGGTSALAPPWSNVQLYGTTRQFSINPSVGSDITVTAASGHVLRPGSYSTNPDDPAGTQFWVTDTWTCEPQHASLNITTLNATSDGTITAIAFTFVSHCDSDGWAMVGTVRVAA